MENNEQIFWHVDISTSNSSNSSNYIWNNDPWQSNRSWGSCLPAITICPLYSCGGSIISGQQATDIVQVPSWITVSCSRSNFLMGYFREKRRMRVEDKWMFMFFVISLFCLRDRRRAHSLFSLIRKKRRIEALHWLQVSKQFYFVRDRWWCDALGPSDEHVRIFPLNSATNIGHSTNKRASGNSPL